MGYNILGNITKKNIVGFIAQGAMVVLSLMEYLIKLVYKYKKQLWTLFIIFLALLFVTSLRQKANTPPAKTVAVAKPLSEKEQIVGYIKEVFGKDANDAFKVLSCENGRLNPNARGISPNGTSDVGIFQINSVHGVQERFLRDWRTNIDIAYQIFKDRGWDAWACATVYHALER